MSEIPSFDSIVEENNEQTDFNLKHLFDHDDRVTSYREEFLKIKLSPVIPAINVIEMPTLMKATQGFQGGDLIILSAPTKHGKTLFAQTLTYNLAMDNIHTLWFTLEMTNAQFVNYFVRMDEAKVEEDGKVLDVSDLPIFFPVDNSLLSLQWVFEKIKWAQQKHDIKFVVIDHLHYLLPLKDFNTNISFLIGGIVREVKKIALNLKIPIMLICHTKKTNPGEISIEDIRDSSFITQESDFTILMRREMSGNDDEVYTNKTKMILAANRRTGETPKFDLIYKKGRLFEADKIYE